MRRFFKGLSSLRPSAPRYEHTWDPQLVLNHLSTLPDNSELTLDRLSRKTAILIALITAHRVQTLTAINISNISIGSSKIEIEIPERIKTSSAHNKQPLLVIPYFDSNVKICPARTLIAYLSATATIRASESYLFVTFKKPIHRATSQTVSRWIRDVLGESGIDVSVYKAHSTRNASTSAAYRQGVSIEAIRKAAG